MGENVDRYFAPKFWHARVYWLQDLDLEAVTFLVWIGF